MDMIRPRLNDFHNLPFCQEEVDFAIPFLDEDIPLYVDPFLLWKSPSMQDNSLHTLLINSFNYLGNQFVKGIESDMKKILIRLSECNEVGFGTSKTRRGRVISDNIANNILSLYKNIPQINTQGFMHFEEIQLLVDNISKDRISDFCTSIIKSFLIDYTIDQCQKLKIPLVKSRIDLFDNKKFKIKEEEAYLPINPNNNQPIILVPKRWLRFTPWINFDDYFTKYIIDDIEKEYDGIENRIEVLKYNRENYAQIQNYITLKEEQTSNCTNDPLFTQIPITSSKKKVTTILKLPTGKTENADKKYEDLMAQVLASFLYPHLDFAQSQSRVDSGTQIRDVIFYNNRSYNFLQEIYDTYDCKQIVLELKNVEKVEREHINQLNRYLSNSLGKFGVIFTRNKAPKNIIQNTIDLWSGQRRCILILDDSDLEQMMIVYESKQRLPIEVIKKKYIEFTRLCPN